MREKELKEMERGKEGGVDPVAWQLLHACMETYLLVPKARSHHPHVMCTHAATRTVFAYNINLKAEEKDIFKFFSTAGTIQDIQVSLLHTFP